MFCVGAAVFFVICSMSCCQYIHVCYRFTCCLPLGRRRIRHLGGIGALLHLLSSQDAKVLSRAAAQCTTCYQTQVGGARLTAMLLWA